MEHVYTGMPGQRSLRKRTVPAAGRYNNHLLPLGAGTSDGSAEKGNTLINDRDLCGAAGTEAGVTQRCGTMEGLQIEQPKAHRPVMGLTTV